MNDRILEIRMIQILKPRKFSNAYDVDFLRFDMIYSRFLMARIPLVLRKCVRD